MARIIAVPPQPGLAEHGAVAHLAGAVRALCDAAQLASRDLQGRTLWMVNSTEHGGGVAEMLPAMVALLRDLELDVQWVVLEADEPRFFELTKQIHNLIHDSGEPQLDSGDIALYEAVNRANAEELLEWISPGDIVVIHDPQPLPMAPLLRAGADVHVLWRCHIGLDERTPRTEAAWSLLRRYTDACERVIFSAPEYVPPFLAERSTILRPALDPLAPKNRELSLHGIVCLLASSGLSTVGPTVTPPFEHRVQRVGFDGRTVSVSDGGEFGLLSRPIVLQVSRWDRLKGFLPLMRAFVALKRMTSEDPEHARRIELVRLVLAGPAMGAVSDDPESAEVLTELAGEYARLPAAVQEDIAILLLPMESREQNALIVNALQRASTIVVQNSLREGFGLTVAEAMWKRVAVLSSARACGPRTQIVDGEHGRLVRDPEDVDELASALYGMLASPDERARWARNAQRRAHDEFMVFTQLHRWIELCRDVVAARSLRREA